MRGTLLAGLIVLMLSGCILNGSSPETQEEWGMSEFKIFGRENSFEAAMAAGQPKVHRVADAPEAFEVTRPFWVEGKSLDGEPLKQSRRLWVKVYRNEGESKWQVQSYEFRDVQPLTFQHQFLTWLLWVFFGPILLFLWLWSISGGWVGGARVIVGVLTLPMVGYVSFVCFGSVGAVIVGIIAYIVLAYFLLALLNALLRALSTS